MPLVRLAATPVLPARSAPAAIARAVDGLLSAPHRVLVRAAGTSIAPALTRRVPSPPGLLQVVHALAGRLVVDNPCAVVRLPWAVGAMARAALEAALGAARGVPTEAGRDEGDAATPNTIRDARAAADARRLAALRARLPAAAAALAPGASWAAAALYEPTALRVRLAAPGTEPPEPAPVPAEAWLTYRLALVVGRGEAPDDPWSPAWARADAAAADADAASWPPGPRAGAPWYARRVLVPDAVAAAHMDDATLARWAALTGRGGDRRDRYWFRESWERFCEPGRQVGHVSPDHVVRSRRSHRTPVAAVPAWGAAAPVAPLDPDAEQGVCVPPGYCLVDCVGTLEVAVVAV